VPIRVVVIEDNHHYRSTLEELFRNAEGFELAGSFAAPPPALEHARKTAAGGAPAPWDVAVMDLEMPQMSGIEATRRIKKILPGLKVVVLTVFEQPATILEAICAGADGYLLKKARAPELLGGLRAVLEGGAPLTPHVARSVLSLVRGSSVPAAGGEARTPSRLELTDRELQVLRALVEGLSYKQVADALGISMGTVRTHIVSIYRKLQVHSVAEAVTRALRERIV
jgi:DNA-binding NarL/FixJ family response regulator